MSAFVLQVAIIFLPGLLWARIASVYASRRTPTQFQFLLSALNFGLVSYVIVFFLYSLGNWEFTLPSVQEEMDTTQYALLVDEILSAIAVSLLGAIVWCYAINYRLFMRFLLWIKATSAFGDEDVWEFSFNSNDPAARFINLRDYDKSLVYSGYVHAWSGSDRLRELVLLQVIVYNMDGEELYEMPRMYLSRDMSDLTIEFPTNARSEDANDR